MAGKLEGRIALISGASRGIGAAVARLFAREGAHIIATGRTQGGLEELDDDIRAMGGEATLAPFDITDFEAIDRLGAAVAERWGKLDILVGNAGVLGTLSPLGHIEPAVWDNVMAVNLTANWRLIRSFDPLLRAAGAGRAIFVSSNVTAHPHAYWGAYAVSKAGLDMLARIYGAEVAKTPVKVHVLNLGATRTAMRAQAMPGEDPQSLPSPDEAAKQFLELVI